MSDATARAGGIRQFVVGVFGVLRLALGANAYTWQFVNEAGTVLDSGAGTCH